MQRKPIKSIVMLSALSSVFITKVAIADTNLPANKNEPLTEPSYTVTATNSLWEEKEIPPFFYENPYQVSLFSPKNGEDAERVLSKTGTVFGLGIAVISALSIMPSSITNWEDSDDADLSDKWVKNVSSGPVWDRDEFYLNYIAHPYFGGVSYLSARKSGYRQWDSFVYSFLMSAFYWEYGIEAFAETPSVQDLIVTPVLGWVYGEWALKTERDIWLNDGTVWGSESLGNISLFMLDPVDSIGRNVNRLFGKDIFKAGTGYITYQKDQTETKIGLLLSYQFGGDNSKAQVGISAQQKKDTRYRSQSSDPVDTGIIGLSVGAINVNLDKKWGITHTAVYGQQISLGLYFTHQFSTRLSYTRAKVKAQDGDSSIRYENYGLDMQYYLNPQSTWRPFATAGIGEAIFSSDNDQKYTQVNGGLGLHYKMNANWAIQTDWRHYYGTITQTNDDQFGAAIIYRFGTGEGSL